MAARKPTTGQSDHELTEQTVLLLAQIRELLMAQLMAICYDSEQNEETNISYVANYLGMARRAYSADEHA